MTTALGSGSFLARAAFANHFAALGSPALAAIHSCGRDALLRMISRALAQGLVLGQFTEDKRLEIAGHLTAAELVGHVTGEAQMSPGRLVALYQVVRSAGLGMAQGGAHQHGASLAAVDMEESTSAFRKFFQRRSTAAGQP